MRWEERRVASRRSPPMNILFYCHDDFACNSMGHVTGFAAGLSALGHACAVAIPGDDLASAAILGERPPFRPARFADAWEHPDTLFPDGGPPDFLHVWTPREHVRRAAEHFRRARPGVRLVVHLEDNEEHLAARFLGETDAGLRALPDAELAARLPGHLSHPREAPRFLRTADGVTGIVEALKEFVPPGVPFVELPPGVDFTLFHPGPPDPALRASLGLRAEEKVLCYPGSSHFANAPEMAALYEAVFALNREGTPCRLLRTGRDTPEFVARFAPGDLARYILHLGIVDRDRLPGLLRLADALVQPGRDDAFNRYRLPSKLPEFLASGRPVITPRANVGRSCERGTRRCCWKPAGRRRSPPGAGKCLPTRRWCDGWVREGRSSQGGISTRWPTRVGWRVSTGVCARLGGGRWHGS